MITVTNKTGYIASIAIVLIASQTMAFCLSIMIAASSYADSVDRRELRIQAGLNLESCADSLALMVRKNYRLRGWVDIPDFGCTAFMSTDWIGNQTADIETQIAGVRAFGSVTISRD